MSKKFENLSDSNRNLPRGINNLFQSKPIDTASRGEVSVSEQVAEEKTLSYVRHTVMFMPEDLEFLKNMVYSEKLRGNITYSQKEALHEAIGLLREAKESVVIRPENIVAYEKQRSDSISRGKSLK